ncbi:hypothetical protein [Legionella yabuuchiae]|uniref:hypothetical protein n=1 Tax=Legionella yabuuchiae TaxID=376727 RepID=UPI0010551D09|nr:hypothetical protein [Legionella yabuuchiae]
MHWRVPGTFGPRFAQPWPMTAGTVGLIQPPSLSLTRIPTYPFYFSALGIPQALTHIPTIGLAESSHGTESLDEELSRARPLSDSGTEIADFDTNAQVLEQETIPSPIIPSGTNETFEHSGLLDTIHVFLNQNAAMLWKALGIGMMVVGTLISLAGGAIITASAGTASVPGVIMAGAGAGIAAAGLGFFCMGRAKKNDDLPQETNPSPQPA